MVARRAAIAVVVALAAAGVVVVASQSQEARLSSDFTIEYSAGLLVREGRLDGPYQQPELAKTMQRVAPDSGIDPRLPFNMPLGAALPYAVVSFLPLEVAFRVWQVISLAVMLAALIVLQRVAPLGRSALAWGTLGLLAAVPTWATLTEGQPTSLVMLGAALLVASLRSPNLASALVGGALVAIKPQYLPEYLLVLLAARRWPSLIGAGAAAGVVLLSPLAAGPAALTAMVHNALLANQAVDIHLNEALIGILAWAAPAGLVTALSLVICAAMIIGLGWLAWQKTLAPVTLAIIAGTLTVLGSPHSLPHDLVILAIPAWLLWWLYRGAALPNPFIALLAIDVALLLDLRAVGIPLGPIVMVAAAGWLVWQVRQRAQRQPHRPPVALAG
jgi:hypothetical protein